MKRKPKSRPVLGPVPAGQVVEIVGPDGQGKTICRFICRHCGREGKGRWADLIRRPRWDPSRKVIRRPYTSCRCRKNLSAKTNLECMAGHVDASSKLQMWAARRRGASIQTLAEQYGQLPVVVAKIVGDLRREFEPLSSFANSRSGHNWLMRASELKFLLLHNGPEQRLRRHSGRRPARRIFSEFTRAELRSSVVATARRITNRWGHLRGTRIKPFDFFLNLAHFIVERADRTSERRMGRNVRFKGWYRRHMDAIEYEQLSELADQVAKGELQLGGPGFAGPWDEAEQSNEHEAIIEKSQVAAQAESHRHQQVAAPFSASESFDVKPTSTEQGDMIEFGLHATPLLPSMIGEYVPFHGIVTEADCAGFCTGQ